MHLQSPAQPSASRRHRDDGKKGGRASQGGFFPGRDVKIPVLVLETRH